MGFLFKLCFLLVIIELASSIRDVARAIMIHGNKLPADYTKYKKLEENE